jgi:aryl-alcohol dehydrogenase-like predicted oxidoreductase
VTSVLTAVSSVAQLEDGVKALSAAPFSAKDLRLIDSIVGTGATRGKARKRK